MLEEICKVRINTKGVIYLLVGIPTFIAALNIGVQVAGKKVLWVSLKTRHSEMPW